MNSADIENTITKPKQLFPLVRHMSYRLTPILLRWPITPNQITSFSMFLGLLGAFCFLFGNWYLEMVGGLLLVGCYTFDNCDGEVARIKNLSSDFGAKLDDMADWIVDASFFAALGYGTMQATGEQYWFWFGLAAAAGAVIDYIVDLVREAQLSKKEDARSREEQATDPKQPEDWIDWLIYVFHKLSRADFCLIVLVLAIFKLTWILLPFAAIGAQVYWITDLFERARGYHT